MPNKTQDSVVSLWRYPVKSMLGEELSAVEVTERGLLGDRALVKSEGKKPKSLSEALAELGFVTRYSEDQPRGILDSIDAIQWALAAEGQ
jgi:Uncharacterized Fe-S protein